MVYLATARAISSSIAIRLNSVDNYPFPSLLKSITVIELLCGAQLTVSTRKLFVLRSDTDTQRRNDRLLVFQFLKNKKQKNDEDEPNKNKFGVIELVCVNCHFVVVVFFSFLLLCLIHQEGCGGNVLIDPSGCIWQDILSTALAFF